MIVNEIIKEPKISIIITYYNLGKYIRDCVLSILDQTYEKFEIIIVNDGSDSENSIALGQFDDKRIKIINLRENKGQFSAFLEGLKEVSGEFVCMVDADDVLLPNYLKTLLAVHLKTNYAFVSCACGEVNQNTELISMNYVNNPIKREIEKIARFEVENLFNQCEHYEIFESKTDFGFWDWNPSTSAMFRKEALEIVKDYPDVAYWKTGADKVIFSLLHLLGGSANIDAVCFLYRHHQNNNFNSAFTTGNKKLLNEDSINKLIAWNKKLRIDVLKMFLVNKASLIERYNNLNYLKMFMKVIFSFNIKFCAKVIKTFAHKLIRF